MLKKIGLLASCLGLANCATVPFSAANCTNLISGTGGVLKFCQTIDRIAITETGIVAGRRSEEVAIVDDPITLAALAKQLRLNRDLSRSRGIIKRACVVNGDGYISIRSTDLARLLESGKQQNRTYSVRN